MVFSRFWCFIIIVLAAFTMGPAVIAATLPVKNLGFEDWNSDKTKPTGWWVGGTGYEASADCSAASRAPEGNCALRLRSTQDLKSGAFMPLSQNLPSRFAAGHQIKLSGFIRTENVQDGWAGIWMRVDAPGKLAVAFDNMSKRAPRGTTDWQRFEIALPVAPNTSNIAFGVLLSGGGTAWFDDLKLEVDESVQVPKADLPEIAAVSTPARPVVPPNLLDDSALALAVGDTPAVNELWQVDIRERHHAIRSLTSADFSDLQFLKPFLKDKRIVQLGESGHGVAEFNWMKVRLIKFLHQELGYDVIAFESSMTGCDGADESIGKNGPVDVMRECIFPIWHTTEVLPLFDYLDVARKAGGRISLAGFDIQNSSRVSRQISERFKAMLESINSDLAVRVNASHSKLHSGLSTADATDLKNFYREVAETLTVNRSILHEKYRARPIEVDLAIQEALSRVQYVKQLEEGSAAGSSIRDKGMANNLDFLLDKLYPGRKVIVWAHNYHITYQQIGQDKPNAMGAWVAERRKAEAYTVGFFMGRGIGALTDQSLYEIKPPAKDTLEAIFASAGRKMSFVDFSQVKRGPGNAWMFEQTIAREWGRYPIKLVPVKMYDAVLYIDGVTPPQYLPNSKP